MKEIYSRETWKLIRSLFTGGLASIVDLSLLTLLVEAFGFRPAQASLPALLAGAITQFAGSRYFVFRATSHANSRKMSRQILGFAIVETGTLILNALSFSLCVHHTVIPYPVARMSCQFGVYLLFSYPLWRWVFAERKST